MDNPLTNLEETVRRHWQTYRPNMVAALAAAGRLETAIADAARRTREAVLGLTDQGMPLLTAWEQMREEWALLPAEAEAPEVLVEVQDDGRDEDAPDGEEEFYLEADDDGAWLKRWPTARETLAALLAGGALPDPAPYEEAAHGVWMVGEARVSWLGGERLAELVPGGPCYWLERAGETVRLVRDAAPAPVVLSQTALTPGLVAWLDDPVGQLAWLVWGLLEIKFKEARK